MKDQNPVIFQSYFNVSRFSSGLFLLGSIALLLSACASPAGKTGSSDTGPGPEASQIELLSDPIFPQWFRVGGSADFELVEGVLIGTSKPNTPNSFLCPPKRYGNFELEFETKIIDPRLNSGVQIRSLYKLDELNTEMPEENQNRIRKILNKGERMYGPQVEIDDNGNAGGIWFEVGRGWLSKPDAERGKAIFNNDDWNHFRVVANGSKITVHVNGEKVTDMDEQTTFMREGYLGFQVHSVAHTEPSQVMWRNIVIREIP